MREKFFCSSRLRAEAQATPPQPSPALAGEGVHHRATGNRSPRCPYNADKRPRTRGCLPANFKKWLHHAVSRGCARLARPLPYLSCKAQSLTENHHEIRNLDAAQPVRRLLAGLRVDAGCHARLKCWPPEREPLHQYALSLDGSGNGTPGSTGTPSTGAPCASKCIGCMRMSRHA